jgi:hypothetical protein
MKTGTVSKGMMWLGIGLILMVGLIHVLDAPGSFDDAAYKGWLFYGNGLAALVAAVGIYRGERTWGWTFGALIAAVSILMYVASRSVGLPQIPAEPDAWLEPLGVAATLSELFFLAVYARVMPQVAGRLIASTR